MATTITERLSGAPSVGGAVSDLAAIEELSATGVPERTGANAWILRDVTGADGGWSPATAEGLSLGTTALPWSSAYLGEGGVVDWGSGDVTVTHAANALSFEGASSGYAFDAALFIAALSAAVADRVGHGQLWVKDDTPNTLWFTDDGGADHRLASSRGLALQIHTSSGTHTPTSGTIFSLVLATGGGGGGGGADTVAGDGQASAGGGGGGAGTGISLLNATEMGATAAVTIGAAGSAGSSSGGDGGDGGNTIFNPAGTRATITGEGGEGGDGIQSSTDLQKQNGGDGGSAVNATLTLDGAGGGIGFTLEQFELADLIGVGGNGGGSFWGAGGRAGIEYDAFTEGADGPVHGAGGGGAGGGKSTSGAAGGAGAAGIVVVLELIEA